MVINSSRILLQIRFDFGNTFSQATSSYLMEDSASGKPQPPVRVEHTQPWLMTIQSCARGTSGINVLLRRNLSGKGPPNLCCLNSWLFQVQDSRQRIEHNANEQLCCKSHSHRKPSVMKKGCLFLNSPKQRCRDQTRTLRKQKPGTVWITETEYFNSGVIRCQRRSDRPCRIEQDWHWGHMTRVHPHSCLI